MLTVQDVMTAQIPIGVVVATITAAGAVLVAIVGKVSYRRGQESTAPPSDAVLERQEGAFQERVGAMLTRLADTIAQGHASHREELREIAHSLRDSATAMRAVVHEVAAHSAQTEPAITATLAMLPLIREVHQRQRPRKRSGRRA